MVHKGGTLKSIPPLLSPFNNIREMSTIYTKMGAR